MARKIFIRRYSDIRYEVQLAEIDLCLGRFRFAAVALNFERMLPSGQIEPIDGPEIAVRYGESEKDALETVEKPVMEWIDQQVSR